MVTVTQRLPQAATADPAPLELALTAEERTRSRFRFHAAGGEAVELLLPRGTVLRDGDLLADTDSVARVRVRARAEPVLTVRAGDPFLLLRAAYHLGNRHVPLEVGRGYLRLAPDPVLADMLVQLGLGVTTETVPFQPEAGAYAGHSHRHEFVRAPAPRRA